MKMDDVFEEIGERTGVEVELEVPPWNGHILSWDGDRLPMNCIKLWIQSDALITFGDPTGEGPLRVLG